MSSNISSIVVGHTDGATCVSHIKDLQVYIIYIYIYITYIYIVSEFVPSFVFSTSMLQRQWQDPTPVLTTHQVVIAMYIYVL